MTTFGAMLASWRHVPLCGRWADRVLAQHEAGPHWALGCPYCGHHELSGVLHLHDGGGLGGQGSLCPIARVTADTVPSRPDVALRIAHCLACGAAVDPEALLFPLQFLQDRLDAATLTALGLHEAVKAMLRLPRLGRRPRH